MGGPGRPPCTPDYMGFSLGISMLPRGQSEYELGAGGGGQMLEEVNGATGIALWAGHKERWLRFSPEHSFVTPRKSLKLL